MRDNYLNRICDREESARGLFEQADNVSPVEPSQREFERDRLAFPRAETVSAGGTRGYLEEQQPERVDGECDNDDRYEVEADANGRHFTDLDAVRPEHDRVGRRCNRQHECT